MSDEETTGEEPSGGSAGLRAGGSLTSHAVGGGIRSLSFLLISRGSTPSNPPRLVVFGHTPYLSTDSL